MTYKARLESTLLRLFTRLERDGDPEPELVQAIKDILFKIGEEEARPAKTLLEQIAATCANLRERVSSLETQGAHRRMQALPDRPHESRIA